jgi:hypothetical protein
MADLNDRIIQEIEWRRESNPTDFSSPQSLGSSDFPLLLLIVSSVGQVLPSPNLEACAKHLATHSELFALLRDSYLSRSYEKLILRSKALRTASFRGMAPQAKENQALIDAVIPIHMGGIDQAIATETTSAINLQFKNWKHSLDCSALREVRILKISIPLSLQFGLRNSM